jgi:hypothetical protein
MDPGSVARGDELLKNIGYRLAQSGVRPFSSFGPFSSFRPFPVIPEKAEPALDLIRGIHVHRHETAESRAGKFKSRCYRPDQAGHSRQRRVK